MKPPFGKPGLSRFVFAALLVLFNWPLLSIPGPGALFGWLFILWGLAIILLFLSARSVDRRDNGHTVPPGADQDGPDPFRPGPSGTDRLAANTAEPEGGDV